MKKIKNKTDIEINYIIQIKEYDFKSVQRDKDIKLSKDERKKYLQDEKYLEVNDELIKKIAVLFTKTDEIELIKSIYGVVLSHLQYGGRVLEDKGAVYALRNGIGDCTEYSDLFITLCRAKNIPARYIEGYMVEANIKDHDWIEIFITGLGWVPFDPTAEDTGGTATFETLPNNYVYFSFKRNDEVLNYYHYTTWWWEGNRTQLYSKVKINKIEK